MLSVVVGVDEVGCNELRSDSVTTTVPDVSLVSVDKILLLTVEIIEAVVAASVDNSAASLA